MEMGKILLVDGEQSIRDLITEVLALSGFEVTTAADGLEALNKIRTEKFDLILLDVNLPKLDGFAVLEKVRESAPTQPIIMLSARIDKDDVTHGLRLGADDYVRKPFSVEELILRLDNLLKRNKSATPSVITCGPIALFEAEHKVTFNESEVDLSPTEFNLLVVLMQNPGRVLTKEKLLDVVWGLDFETSTNVVDTYISYLRKKLHKYDFEGIKTVRGVGFKLDSK